MPTNSDIHRSAAIITLPSVFGKTTPSNKGSSRWRCWINKKHSYRRGTARRAMLVMFHEVWEL